MTKLIAALAVSLSLGLAGTAAADAVQPVAQEGAASAAQAPAARFKGRGPIQLTGRANYEAAGKALKKGPAARFKGRGPIQLTGRANYEAAAKTAKKARGPIQLTGRATFGAAGKTAKQSPAGATTTQGAAVTVEKTPQ